MRRAPRIDANQTEIVTALRAIGCKVQHLAGVAGGCPDLLVGHRKRLMLLEVKDGSLAPSHQALTRDQVMWHAEWNSYPVHVVNSVEAAIKVVQEY